MQPGSTTQTQNCSVLRPDLNRCSMLSARSQVGFNLPLNLLFLPNIKSLFLPLREQKKK